MSEELMNEELEETLRDEKSRDEKSLENIIGSKEHSKLERISRKLEALQNPKTPLEKILRVSCILVASYTVGLLRHEHQQKSADILGITPSQITIYNSLWGYASILQYFTLGIGGIITKNNTLENIGTFTIGYGILNGLISTARIIITKKTKKGIANPFCYTGFALNFGVEYKNLFYESAKLLSEIHPVFGNAVNKYLCVQTNYILHATKGFV